MKSIFVFVAILLAGVSAAFADGHRTASPEGAELYFIAPADGDTIKGPVTVRFGLRGMGVAPAGVDKAGTGHHHLIINAPLPSFEYSIFMDENHVHFGGGQTEAQIDLPPGIHTLQLLLADQNHIPHDPAVFSKKITITIVE